MTKVIKTSLPTKNWPSKVPVRIVVPDTIENQSERVPVLYLLHGLFGSCDNWIEMTDLLALMNRRRYIIVTPEAYDSWYVNSASDERHRYEDFFVTDLIPWVDEQFSGGRKRAVAGLSMGGFGALKFALKWPRLFEFAWSSSGAILAPKIDACSDGFDELKESVCRAFGPLGSETRSANDVFELIKNADVRHVPEIILDCGTSDEFMHANREFETALGRARIDHSYQEPKGGHDWDYWGNRLVGLLAISDDHFN